MPEDAPGNGVDDPLKPQRGDLIHTIIRAGISSIPLAGGPLVEFFATYLPAPMAKRRDAFLISLDRRLKVLQNTIDDLDPESLSKNDAFVSILLHAIQIAMRNHQEEKLEALTNVVLNVATKIDIDVDLQMTFLGLVDTFSPSHIRVLHYCKDPQAWAKDRGIKYPFDLIKQFAIQEILGFGNGEAPDPFFSFVLKDLYDGKLITTDDANLDINPAGETGARLTSFGSLFLMFITSPIPF